MKKILSTSLSLPIWFLSIVFSLIVFSSSLWAANPRAIMETSMGNIELELFADKAPISVQNFIKYAESGFYDGTIFHRVIQRFMIQGGGFDKNMQRKPTRPPIRNEAENMIPNVRGTIAMARTSAPHSATSQFFINTKNNDFLNFREKTPRAWGYAVFGRVIKGMDVVMKIEKVKTGNRGRMRNVPVKTVEIKTIRIIK